MRLRSHAIISRFFLSGYSYPEKYPFLEKKPDSEKQPGTEAVLIPLLQKVDEQIRSTLICKNFG